MIVTELEPYGKTKVKVYIDYEYAFMLTIREARTYQLEEDVVIEDDLYHEIYQEVVLPKVKLKAMDILKSSDRTEHELMLKLQTAGFSEEAVEEALAYVKSFNYVNDYRYTCNYINFRKHSKSKKMLQFELGQKGIGKDMIERAMEEELPEDFEEVTIKRELEKKVTDFTELSYEDKMKLSASLFRKGFSSYSVRKVMDELTK